MARIVLCVVFFLSVAIVAAQKKKEIKKYGIRSVTTTDTRSGKTVNDSKVTYDGSGEVIEEVNYDKEGVLKSTLKYKYNKDGDALEESEYDEKGILKEKKTYKYNAMGEKVEELVTDKDNKVLKKVIHIYDSKGLKIEKKTYDGNNVLLSSKKISYGYKKGE